MDKKSMIFFAIMMLAMFYFTNQMNRQKQVVPTVVTFAQVQSMEQKAGNDKNRLNDVIKGYNEVIKENEGKEDAAKAGFQIAVIQETKLDQEAPAVKSYQAVVQDFPPSSSPIGKEAQQRMLDLENRIDGRNSKEFGYKAIDSLVALTGRNPKYSFAIALLIITLIVKIVTTPLSHKQYKSMKEMQKITPLVKELQVKYKNDQKALGEKTMELYKEHGVNPFASCLPLVIQMPILIGLYYKVILAYQYQFAKGHFLWIGSSLANNYPAFTKLAVLGHTFKIPLIAANLAMPDLALLLLYTASMVISQKLTVVDPSQADQQKVMAWTMPLMFAFVFASFPSALMLYWLLFNVISTAQQYFIMRPTYASNGETIAIQPAVETKSAIPSKVSKKKK